MSDSFNPEKTTQQHQLSAFMSSQIIDASNNALQLYIHPKLGSQHVNIVSLLRLLRVWEVTL